MDTLDPNTPPVLPRDDAESTLPQNDAVPVTGPPPPPLPARIPARVLLISIFLGLAGIFVLCVAVGIMLAGGSVPWSRSVVVISDSAPWEGMERAWVRTLARESLPPPAPFWTELEHALQATEDGRMIRDVLDAGAQERVIAIDAPLDGVALESGRVPERGANEVLAGDLARWDTITLDGTEFKVVGRLHRRTSVALFAYLLPYDPVHAPLFEDSSEAQRAWFDEEGLVHLAGMPRNEALDELPDDAELLGGMTRAQVPVVLANFLGIALVVAGAAGITTWLFRALTRLRMPVAGALFTAAAHWPRLFIAHHAVFFGMFLVVMMVGASFPRANMHLMNFIQGIFLEGHLQYVGDAYASGNIIRAAIATFFNNYVQQTLLYTLAASVIVPFLGLLKTTASFLITGFGMAPIWTSTIQLLPFHAITIGIELEAYIVACFAVTLWPVYIVLAIVRRRLALVGHGAAIMVSAAIVSGVLLALGALYEAASLILLSM